MPSLIVSSRFTSDSQALRQAAQQRGWETLRLDGDTLPDWFHPPDEQIALFYTAPHAFDIAAQLSRALVGCNADWTVRLPAEFLLRELRQVTLEEALRTPGIAFIKHSVSKAFPSALYSSATLAAATSSNPPGALVHVGEPVEWLVEYRCFVLEGEVATISPYRRHGVVIENHSDRLGASPREVADAISFAERVLASVACPPAFVLDVGVIQGRNWAVVECNECWASGIYACDTSRVLDTLLRACVPSSAITGANQQWNFKSHYFAACCSRSAK